MFPSYSQTVGRPICGIDPKIITEKAFGLICYQNNSSLATEFEYYQDWKLFQSTKFVVIAANNCASEAARTINCMGC